MATALVRGESMVRTGGTYLVDARVEAGYADEARSEHTSGRKA
jgi:hypothetical protein